jgi:hypothetical protein
MSDELPTIDHDVKDTRTNEVRANVVNAKDRVGIASWC